MPQDQRRDDERMYHKFTLRELTKKAPFLNWTKYFDDAFDYHSKTTITFSSKIKSRVGQTSTLIGGSGTGSAPGSAFIQPEYSITNTQLDLISPSSASSLTISAPSTVANSIKNNLNLSTMRTSNSSTNSSTANFRVKPETGVISKHRITEEEHVIIYSPEYFEDLSNLIMEYQRTDKGKTTLANYMAWSVIQSLIATLPKNFRDASKALRKALIGSEGIEVSWRYCVTDTNQVMGFALGSLFVRRVFQGKSKERAEEMIFNIRNAFKENLANLNWMDDRTRQLAREKADHINQMIGFPDFILSPEILNEKYEGVSRPSEPMIAT